MTVPLDGRGFVVGSAATALAAGGIEGILAARRAPAQQAGVEIAVERIDQNDIQARTTAAIQSGSGPDIIVINNNYPQLYEGALADVSDVAEDMFAKSIQGMAPEDAVKWADGELKRIYGS